MIRSIMLTEIVNKLANSTSGVVHETTYRIIVIPLARIDHAEESESIIYTERIARGTGATKIVKVNGDTIFVSENIDEVIALMNADKE